VDSYINAVPPGFSFTVKAPQRLTQAVLRGKAEKNADFLSAEYYSTFYRRIEPIEDSVEAVILEFEYMNRQKMPGLAAYEERLGAFLREIPRGIPVAIECRNGSYLTAEFFDFLRDIGASAVLSEKQFMPPIVDLIDEHSGRLGDRVVVRLLGGDRKAIEERTKEKWDEIVEPKDIPALAARLGYLVNIGKNVTVNVNNHYEGSAPLTVERLRKALDAIA
jgi:uncharacterized protein YecE (DUF72 family)